eukprot:jgi/Tetstr1/446786/TSEL_034267.t1
MADESAPSDEAASALSSGHQAQDSEEISCEQGLLLGGPARRGAICPVSRCTPAAAGSPALTRADRLENGLDEPGHLHAAEDEEPVIYAIPAPSCRPRKENDAAEVKEILAMQGKLPTNNS